MSWLLHTLIKLSCLIAATLPSTAKSANTKLGCQKSCGNLEIQYPFGIGEGCFIAKGFDINCNTSYNPPRPFLDSASQFEVLQISADQVRVKNSVAYFCVNESGGVIPGPYNYSSVNLTGSPFTFSYTANKFTVLGCNSNALLHGANTMRWCVSLCHTLKDVTNRSCSGLGCCQASIPQNLKSYITTITSYETDNLSTWEFNPCGYAFLADQEKYNFAASDLGGRGDVFLNKIKDVTVVLDWAVGNRTCEEAIKHETTYACRENSICRNSQNGPGYRCICKEGYQGNPYLSPGCQDINECEDLRNPCEGRICTNLPGSYLCNCPYGTHNNSNTCILNNAPFSVLHFALAFGFGLFLLLGGVSWLYLIIKKQKLIKLRQKFFKQNGGLLLQQHISLHKGAIELTKIFTAQELENATDNYSDTRIIGRGGHGTVYKGFLSDNKVVAIKKSKIMDKTKIEQFINEVVILMQVNHRNVVKLLGCCLETEVPSLVYEFVFNGSLYDHIRGKTRTLSWDLRLRIAMETACALAYLHSATSVPIIHRDVKSANILLDDKYAAKVSDFGTSRLIPLDKSQITTLVQGTLGYLDPEYFQTSQLTENSDVYSFGVVLVELLTGKVPVCFDRPENQRNLSSYFIQSIQQNRLFQIIDARVLREGDEEQLMTVAELARKWLKLKGEERPTMKEVVTELEGLTRFEKNPTSVQCSSEENVGLLNENLSGLQFSYQYNAENSMMLSLTLPR